MEPGIGFVGIPVLVPRQTDSGSRLRRVRNDENLAEVT
jgi:hypothetical protein